MTTTGRTAMANIHISLAGEGRSQTARALDLLRELDGSAHTITVHAAGDVLHALLPAVADGGLSLRELPAGARDLGGSEQEPFKRLLSRISTLASRPRALDALEWTLRSGHADLVLSDRDSLLTVAAKRAGIPVVILENGTALPGSIRQHPLRSLDTAWMGDLRTA